MFFKKTVLIGFSLLSLPFALHALTTNNYTSQPSTVKITTGSLKICSSILPGGITQAHEMNHVVPKESIKKICMGSSGNKCGANIFMTNNCSGDVVEQAILDMNTGIVTLSGHSHPKFLVEKIKDDEINFREKKLS